MIIHILGVLTSLAAGLLWAGYNDAPTAAPIPAVHYRDTAADREARLPPPPRFVQPTTPPSYYQTPPVSPPADLSRPPYYQRPYRPMRPVTADDLRPRRPPEFIDFGDEFTDIVTQYVSGQAKKNQGAFVVKDDRDGKYHYLRFVRVHRDRITRLSPTEVFGCAEFEGMRGGGSRFDLDFYLTNDDWEWKVGKLLIHKVDGQARFHYNSDHQLVALNAPAAKAPDALAGEAAPAVVPRPKAPAQLDVQVSFREPSGADVLTSDSQAELAVTVSNSGRGPAYAVRIVPALQGDVPGLAMPGDVPVGDIAPGKKATVSVSLRGSADLRSQKARIKLSVNEGNGFDADPVVVEFKTKASKPPRLEVAAVKLRGGTVKAGESTAVSVTVRNSGGGTAAGVGVVLTLGSPDIFMSGEPAADLGTLRPGQSRSAEFEFFVKKRYQGEGPLPVLVALSESRGKYGTPALSLGLALGQGAPAPQVVSIQEKASEAEADLEDVDNPPAVRTLSNPDAYAVVVGIERYRDIPAVEFAARDARSVYDYLTRAMGFDPKNVIHLEDERATRTDLATYLGPWLKDRVTKDSRVFIFYSGHGSPNPTTGDGYLIPYDGKPNYVDTTAFPLKQLYDNLAALPTKDVTVVLDSCFSGAGGRSFLARGVRPLVNVRLAVPNADLVVLSAAQGDQISTYYPETQHGLLTYFLLKGLRGAADSDRDNHVTTGELFSYVQPAVEREARKQHVEQSPTLAPPLTGMGARARQVWLKLK